MPSCWVAFRQLFSGKSKDIMPEPDLVPDQCIVPLVVLNEDGSCGRFLGTAFFVNDPPVLITCAHVLGNDSMGVAVACRDHPGRLFPANRERIDVKSDLACLRVRDYEPLRFLALAKNENLMLNHQVCCFEYSTTVVAGDRINFSPSNRMGNVTRFRDLTSVYGVAGDQMLELSFPALLGASGAPVMDSLTPYHVWGVVTANYASEPLPAHIEKILDDKGVVTEETKFYLPQALAIHVKHVRSLISGIA